MGASAGVNGLGIGYPLSLDGDYALGHPFPEYAGGGSSPAATAQAALAKATGLGRSAALSLT
jgi:hypothetical protein